MMDRMTKETFEGDPTILIESVSNPDGPPMCLITWGALQYPAPVEDIRETALDLIVAAAYAEAMMKLAAIGLDAKLAQEFIADLLSDREKRYFGAKSTITLAPAGSSKQGKGFVLLQRGSMKGGVDCDEARAMARHWLAAAEASESDQIMAEALRTVGGLSAAQRETVFAYLQKLRAPR